MEYNVLIDEGLKDRLKDVIFKKKPKKRPRYDRSELDDFGKRLQRIHKEKGAAAARGFSDGRSLKAHGI